MSAVAVAKAAAAARRCCSAEAHQALKASPVRFAGETSWIGTQADDVGPLGELYNCLCGGTLGVGVGDEFEAEAEAFDLRALVPARPRRVA